MPVFPLLITRLNCLAVCGDHWRHISEWALAHGVRIHQLGRRPVIIATELLAAIQREGEAASAEQAVPTGITGAERIRRSLGVRKKPT